MGSAVGTTQRRFLPLMWLGVLKTAVFAGFKRRHGVPAHFAAACGALDTAAGPEIIVQNLSSKEKAEFPMTGLRLFLSNKSYSFPSSCSNSAFFVSGTYTKSGLIR
jgi:hypothetical protein